MEYYNQRDHALLDRKAIRDLLHQWTQARVVVGQAGYSRAEQFERLSRLAGSELERYWLQFLEEHTCRLPSDGQLLIEACKTRPDFFYADTQAVIYVDGPPHEYPERQQRNAVQTECLEDHGYLVIRFRQRDNWAAVLAQYPHIFGRAA
jgi:very-short-patch-repair endonuclease